VVFGDHNPDDIHLVLADVWTENRKAAVLVNALFPKKKSWLEGLA
jgi:hypothetical protein